MWPTGSCRKTGWQILLGFYCTKASSQACKPVMSFICSTTEKKKLLFYHANGYPFYIFAQGLLVVYYRWILLWGRADESLPWAHKRHKLLKVLRPVEGKQTGPQQLRSLCVFLDFTEAKTLGYRLSSLTRCSSCLEAEMTVSHKLIERSFDFTVALFEYLCVLHWNVIVCLLQRPSSVMTNYNTLGVHGALEITGQHLFLIIVA